MSGALSCKPMILAKSCVVLRGSTIERSACYTEGRFGDVWSYTLAVATVAELKRENRHPRMHPAGSALAVNWAN